MKRIILLFLLLFPIVASAQEKGFSIDGTSLKWQKVYQAQDVAIQDVAYNLQAAGVFHSIEKGDGMVTCELQGLGLDYKGSGFKRMSLPLYIANDKYSAFVTVQVREGRYRVTVDRIRHRNSNYGDGPLETFAIDKDGAFKEAFLGAPADVIEYTFDGLFSGLAKPVDDEW